MSHRYACTERDLRWLAVNYSAGRITKGLPERLECLAAWHRMVVEAEKASSGGIGDWEAASRAYGDALARLRAAGVADSEGEFAFSPCCGPDAPVDP